MAAYQLIRIPVKRTGMYSGAKIFSMEEIICHFVYVGSYGFIKGVWGGRQPLYTIFIEFLSIRLLVP